MGTRTHTHITGLARVFWLCKVKEHNKVNLGHSVTYRLISDQRGIMPATFHRLELL